jgi:hypothetical protein
MVRGMTSRSAPALSRRGTGFAAWCLLLVAVVALLVAVAAPLVQLAGDGGTVPVTLADPDAVRDLHLPGLPDGTEVHMNAGSAHLFVESLPAGLRLLTAAGTSTAALAVAAGAWLLFLVLRSVRESRPFDRRNPGRLVGVAAAVVLGGVVAPALDTGVAAIVLDRVGLAGPDSPLSLVLLDLSFAPLLIAAVVLAAADAFRRGAALADDAEGLV